MRYYVITNTACAIRAAARFAQKLRPGGTVRAGPVIERGLEPGRYMTLIARSVPENSILDLVKGFSARRRECNLVILGLQCLALSPALPARANPINGRTR